MSKAERALIPWLIKFAPLLSMCEVGGWPDFAGMHITTCHHNAEQWVVIVDFNEHLREISVCEPVIHNRCAKFAISLNASGDPEGVDLITNMSWGSGI